MNPLSQIGKKILKELLRSYQSLISALKAFFKRNKYGVMGTLAFHMLILIVLLSFKLNTRKEFTETEIFIDIPPEVAEQILKEEQEKIEKALEEKNSKISQSVSELLRSIAVNQNIQKSKADPARKVEKMIDEIRKNLNQFTSDEYGNNKKDLKDFRKDSLSAIQEKKKQRMLDSLESIEYSGPSSVSYNLEGRHKLYLPIPIFKCEGEGLVVVEIVVNRNGRVENAKILRNKSGVEDECLFEAALQASGRTRFNVSVKSPKKQVGTINYQFVKQ